MPGSTPAAGRRSAAFVGFLVFIELCSGILQGGFPVLLPAIGTELGLGPGDLSTAFSVELLAAGLALPLLARLGDIFGHRRLIQITVAVTLAGYALVALADGFALLVIGRILSGALACWLPLEFAIVRDRLGTERSGPAIGLLVGALSVGVSFGGLVVGLVDDAASSVRVSLWVLVALLAVCLLVSLFLIPESEVRSRGRVDWVGGLLVALGLGLAFDGIAALASSPGRAGAEVLAGAVLLALFVRCEKRTADPLIDVRVMGGRALAPVYWLSMMLGLSIYGSLTSAPAFAAADPAHGYGWGLATLGVSAVSMCSAVGILAGGLAADRAARLLGERAVLAAGFALSAAGYAAIALVHAHPWQFGLGLFANGLGVGLAMSAIPLFIIRRTPADRTAVATGVYNTLKSLAGGIAGAIFGAVLNRMALPGTADVPREGGYIAIWAGCALLCLAAVAIAAALRPTSAPTPEPQQA
ncbi:MFS transporter [Nocardiopsis composta]|uniref:MFS family permease n=1 Tax=Nocardiopsis composta TaxID=157465 RepID=A0A7W8QJN2_9ACTN|nr:MFS transporter [Nocardiopsis composta]MBB5431464.1 MFS family permease [Nocardiopsis composta]